MHKLKQKRRRPHKTHPPEPATLLTGKFIVEVLQRAAKKIRATILLEPEWGCVGQINYRSGVRRYFRLSTLDLNTMGASEIARDKGYARFFLDKMGYPVPQGQTFLSPKRAKTLRVPARGGYRNAWLYAKSIGLPVFVKPNSLSRGIAVSKATTYQEFCRAASQAMKQDKVIVVEKAVSGRDYRLVVLDGKVISAYERIPLTVTGDGSSTIRKLLDIKQKKFIRDERDTLIDREDFRLHANLARMKMGFNTVLEKGRKIQLLDNANLSGGGTSVDMTAHAHPLFKKLAVNIAHDMGLRLVGVDLIIEGGITAPPQTGHYWVIEVNSAPGLDHYAAMGDKQKKIVDKLYLQVIKAMEHPQK